MVRIAESELSVKFNDAGEFVEGADKAGDDGDERKPGWKQRAEDKGRSLKPRRGKGYGYRRNSD